MEARASAELLRARERAATVGPWEPLLVGAHGRARDPGWLLSSTELRHGFSRSGCGTDGAWGWLRARSLPSLASVGWLHFKSEMREERARRACVSRMIVARAARRASKLEQRHAK